MSSFAKGLALLLSSLTATAPAAAQVQPSFSDKGVEANAYGAERHYPMPPPDRPFDQSTIIGWHSHYDHIASKLDTVAKAAAPSPLEYGKAEIASAEIHDYLDHNPVTSFAVARDNTILSEHYLYARTDKNRFLSNSMAKSITGLLVGIALSDGAIRSLDDTAQTYVPELTGTEYGITPIRALLHMASGVQFGETYQPGSDILKLQAALLWPGAVGAPRALKPFNTRLVPPSTCSMSQRSPPATTIFAAARQATGISCGCCQAAAGRSRWPAGSGNGCSSILPRTSSWRKPPSR